MPKWPDYYDRHGGLEAQRGFQFPGKTENRLYLFGERRNLACFPGQERAAIAPDQVGQAGLRHQAGAADRAKTGAGALHQSDTGIPTNEKMPLAFGEQLEILAGETVGDFRTHIL